MVLTSITDPNNLATLTVSVDASTAAGFNMFIFSVAPLQPNTEVGTIEGSFSTENTGTTMRQFPGVVLQTVFTDSNSLFPLINPNESATGFGDSQFRFGLAADGLLTGGTASESSTSLDAAFTGFDPFQSNRPIAHVVMAPLDTFEAHVAVIVRQAGVSGEGEKADFGTFLVGQGVAAVPEASPVLMWSLLLASVAIGASVIKRRRKAQLEPVTDAP